MALWGQEARRPERLELLPYGLLPYGARQRMVV